MLGPLSLPISFRLLRPSLVALRLDDFSRGLMVFGN
jgi:hypothetical protein